MRNLKISYYQGFKYGNCALLAIAYAFGLKLELIYHICNSHKIPHKRGMTDINIHKLINILLNFSQFTIKKDIVSNKLSFREIYLKLPKNKIYIFAIKDHLFTVKNGIIADSYLYKYSEKIKFQPIYYYYTLQENLIFTKKIIL